MPYTWDPKALRYRYPSGRLVPERTIHGRAQRYADGVGESMRQLAEDVIAERISLPEFEAEMRQLLKESHVNMTRLGAGGRASATSSHYGKAGAVLREQYKFLRGFVADLARGRYDAAPGQARARAQMYGRAAYRMYWTSRELTAKLSGYNWKRRVRHAGESCDDCVEQSELGWVAIDDERVTGVRDGSTACLMNCLCTIEYARERPS